MANIETTVSQIVLLDASTTNDVISDGYTRDGYGQTAVQSVGADGSNTFDIEGSLNGTNWVKIGSTISSDTITQITGLYRYLRCHRQSGDSSPLTVILHSADRLRR